MGERISERRPGPVRREKVDPWFLKPYEPSKSASAAQASQPLAPAKPKRQLAALLGGLRKL
jgi:hypothetical protein